MPEPIQETGGSSKPDDTERAAVMARIARHNETIVYGKDGAPRQKAYAGLLAESQFPALTDPEERIKGREYIRAYFSDPDNHVLHEAYVADMADLRKAPASTNIYHYSAMAERDPLLRPQAIELILEAAQGAGSDYHREPLQTVRKLTDPESPQHQLANLIEARGRIAVNKRTVIYFEDSSEGQQRAGREFLQDAATPGLRTDERIDAYRLAALNLSPGSPDMEKALNGYNQSVAALTDPRARIAAHRETIREAGWDSPLGRRISIGIGDLHNVLLPESSAASRPEGSGLLVPAREQLSRWLEKGRALFRHEK